MAKGKIIWSKTAEIKLYKILEFYKERNKSKEYATKLYKKINREILLLQKQPDIGIKTEIESVRGLIIDYYIIFYSRNNDDVIIHTIWDSRQNPNNLSIK
jgi:plasmid stabilization system protein ParE